MDFSTAVEVIGYVANFHYTGVGVYMPDQATLIQDISDGLTHFIATGRKVYPERPGEAVLLLRRKDMPLFTRRTPNLPRYQKDWVDDGED